jgi:WD40 repeat protein
MATNPSARDESLPGVSPLEHARGLAELAFGSLTQTAADLTQARHLALLPTESLELDLDDPAQRQFGDYELLELLGEGGMGVVYRARQASLDREVAVKLLSAGPWASREFIARFEREAQNAARMQHPAIVTIYEVGSFEGMQFFSMRLVRGESLSSRLKRGEKFTPREAAALMRTIAEAVGYAHSLGVLHLDLKPANVLLDETGQPYVADFGLARRLENALAVDNDEVSGTPAYMAPEQAQVRAHKLTAATDIWGLGAILYQLLTGQPPFHAGTAQETVKLVLAGQVRAPRRWVPSLPLDLQAIVMRCLSRDPGGRYPSARALADDLQRYIEGRPVQARPLNAVQRVARWTRREPKLAATIACAIAALIVGLVATTTQWRRADASADQARNSLWATRAQTAQQALAAGDGFRSLRPLIANLAEMEAAGRAGRAGIERERIGTILANAPQLVDLFALPHGEMASSLAISPDGRRFAVATIENGVRRVRQYELATLRETWGVSTENRTFLGGGGDFGAPQANLRYSADGRFLLLSTMEQPVVPAPRTSDMIALDARDGHVLWPDKLPERQADIVYDDALKHALVRFRSDKGLRWPDSAQFYEVAGWKPEGPRHTVATTLAADFWLPAPDGSVWLGSRDTLNLVLYDVPALVPRWRLQLPQTSLVRAWRFSRDGRWLALGSVDGTVRVVSVADGHAVDLPSGPAERVLRVEFSDDGRTLAAIDENGELWSWDVATHAPRAAPLHFAPNDGVTAMLRFAGDTVFGGGNSDSGNAGIAYATLAPRALFNNETVPGAVRLHVMTGFGAAFDVSTSAHRLVAAAKGNMIEIWRLPPSPLLQARAAPMQPLVQTFDGTHLVAVNGNTVRVIDPATGTPRSPPLQHPEPVRFAELAPDGHSLVTIAGRTVRVIDPDTWKLRGAPIVLPQTPERVALAQAAPVLVAATAEYQGDDRHTLIHRIDLARGTVLGKPVSVTELQEFRIDAQARHALVATFGRTRPPAFTRIDLDGAAAPCTLGIKDSWADALAANGRTAWFATQTTNLQLELQHWDLDACRELPMAEPANLQSTAVLMPRGDGLVVHRGGNEALTSFGPDGRRIAAVGSASPNAMYEFALSADGERAAIATRNAVHLLDARGGRRLSAPLAAPIAGDDAIARLAFSPDGSRLAARTINQRWLFWNLPRTESDSAELARLARALDPVPGEPLTNAEIQALRARLHAPAAATPSPPAASDVPVVFAPASGAGVDPRFVPLDLASAINVPMVGKTWAEAFAGGDLPTLAPGPQRFLGVDYRVDGGVQLSGGGTSLALGPQLRRSNFVAVPGIVARRVHVLAFMHIPMNRNVPPRAFAWVVLIGADGRETRLEIRTVRDVVTHGSNPKWSAPSVRIAWVDVESESVRTGGDPAQPWSATYAVALDVPPNTGPIHGLRFDVADGPMEAPLLYAATLERADAEVIKKGVSREPVASIVAKH